VAEEGNPIAYKKMVPLWEDKQYFKLIMKVKFINFPTIFTKKSDLHDAFTPFGKILSC
jgi:hypothetical protein